MILTEPYVEIGVLRIPFRFIKWQSNAWHVLIGVRFHLSAPGERPLVLPIELNIVVFIILCWLFISVNPRRRRWLDWLHYYMDERFIYNLKFAVFNPSVVANRLLPVLQNISLRVSKKIWWRGSEAYDKNDSSSTKPMKVEEFPLIEPLRRNMPFKYQPVEEPNSKMRLVYLYVGAGNDITRLSLIHVSLRRAPKYDALSYRWGDSENGSTVLIDGFSFIFTPSLASALSNLRQVEGTGRTWFLWIVSLCKN